MSTFGEDENFDIEVFQLAIKMYLHTHVQEEIGVIGGHLKKREPNLPEYGDSLVSKEKDLSFENEDGVLEKTEWISDRYAVQIQMRSNINMEKKSKFVHISGEYNRWRNQNNLICNFCKTNGETEDVYRSHRLKNENNLVICPILFKHVCPYCKKTGHEAHTNKYCHMLKGVNFFSIGHNSTQRMANGKLRQY